MNLNQSFNLTEDLGITLNLLGLTGKKYLEMDRYERSGAISKESLTFEPRYPVITSHKSDFGKIGNALDIILQMVKAVDIEKVSYHLGNVSEKLDRMLGDTEAEGLGEDLVDAVREVKAVSEKINRELDRMQAARRVAKTLDRSAALLQEVTETTQSANRLIRRTDNNVNRLSQKLERSADHLDEFMRIIKKKPSMLLYGRPEKREEE